MVFSLKILHSSWPVPHLLTTKKWTLCLSSSHQEQLLPTATAVGAAAFRHAGDRPSSEASLNLVYTAISSADFFPQQWGCRPCMAGRQGTAHSLQPLQHFVTRCLSTPSPSLPATGTDQARQLNADNVPLLHATQKWWTHHTPFTSENLGMLAPNISETEVIPINPKIPLLLQEQQNLLGRSLTFRRWSLHSNRTMYYYNLYSARTGLLRTLHCFTINQTMSSVGHHLKPSSGHAGVTLIYTLSLFYNLKALLVL